VSGDFGKIFREGMVAADGLGEGVLDHDSSGLKAIFFCVKELIGC
jgi:hypothetical protein